MDGINEFFGLLAAMLKAALSLLGTLLFLLILAVVFDGPAKPKTTFVSGTLKAERNGTCTYAMDDGSDVDVEFGIVECPKHWSEEIDAEAP